eukprot:CAMPEP_0172164894 /NCGR_PEP_ID=MMETSP1050-20130122/8103_1 /TAXON_ID=233186 /ORGANISM="Cryptomonas curvata, Strain CCAP979/52" /LENGTH=216 /DNA_ID=CAMNT_0012835291 /DNA_START=87 /DNA_END=734 /DNA_ORIENTATION=+
MAALAAALAKKRAEKMGLQNEEVDDSNVGKQGEEATLKNPFLGKLKATPTAGPQLSPRSKRLAEMSAQANKENEGSEKAQVETKQPAPPPAPPVPSAPMPAPAPQVDLGAPYSAAAACSLQDKITGSASPQMQLDAATVIQRWCQREPSRSEATSSSTVFEILATVASGSDPKAREKAVAILMEVCGQAGVKERLHESGVAFAPLQSMMASPHDAT